jgi:hypothetical protein
MPVQSEKIRKMGFHRPPDLTIAIAWRERSVEAMRALVEQLAALPFEGEREILLVTDVPGAGAGSVPGARVEVHRGANLAYAGHLDVALSAASAPIVLLLHEGVEPVEGEWLDAVRAAFGDGKGVAAVFGQLKFRSLPVLFESQLLFGQRSFFFGAVHKSAWRKYHFGQLLFEGVEYWLQRVEKAGLAVKQLEGPALAVDGGRSLRWGPEVFRAGQRLYVEVLSYLEVPWTEYGGKLARTRLLHLKRLLTGPGWNPASKLRYCALDAGVLATLLAGAVSRSEYAEKAVKALRLARARLG